MSKSIKQTFGVSPTPEQIRQARTKANLTQAAAAKLIYRTLNTWQKWEAGDVKMDAALWELWVMKINAKGATH